MLQSPVGNLLILGNDRSILEIRFPKGQTDHGIDKVWVCGGEVVEACASQLEEYFLAKRQKFDLPVSFSGTAFQQEVWSALQQIPFGKTVSYSHIANRIGRPKAVRAVGAANGANPIPIVIPCHRVIGANGNLTGFGGGLPNKELLLELEGAWNDRLIRV
jgi:methylated-DNA-[protein]-cysteine S-methyltransferase